MLVMVVAAQRIISIWGREEESGCTVERVSLRVVGLVARFRRCDVAWYLPPSYTRSYFRFTLIDSTHNQTPPYLNTHTSS